MISSSRRRFVAALTVVAGVALAVRVAFVVVVDPAVPEIGDASAYHRLANNLAEGRGYVRPFDLALLGEARPTAEYPPLHPALLSLASRLGIDSVDEQRLVMAIAGTATVVVIGLVGRRVGGMSTGIVAAALAAVYPMLFLSDAVLMAETPFMLLVAVSILLAYAAAAAPGLVRFAVLGGALGLAALARAEGLLLAVTLVVPLALGLRHLPARRRWLLAATGVGTAVLVVVPWTVRNAVRLDAFVPVSNNVGTAIDGANCDLTYSGAQIGLWRETFSTLGREARRQPQAVACFEGFAIDDAGFDEAAVTSEHRADGLHYARDHLGRAPLVMGVRWLRTWGLYAPGQQIDFETLEGRPRRWQALGTWMYWALLPLAVVGAVTLARRHQRVWPLLAPTVAVSVSAALTYGQQRFRAAAEPALVVLAAVALTVLASQTGKRSPLPTPRRTGREVGAS